MKPTDVYKNGDTYGFESYFFVNTLTGVLFILPFDSQIGKSVYSFDGAMIDLKEKVMEYIRETYKVIPENFHVTFNFHSNLLRHNFKSDSKDVNTILSNTIERHLGSVILHIKNKEFRPESCSIDDFEIEEYIIVPNKEIAIQMNVNSVFSSAFSNDSYKG